MEHKFIVVAIVFFISLIGVMLLLEMGRFYYHYYQRENCDCAAKMEAVYKEGWHNGAESAIRCIREGHEDIIPLFESDLSKFRNQLSHKE